MTISNQKRDQITDGLQAYQNMIGELRNTFDVDDPGFYGLDVAYQALRVAWYIVETRRDGRIAHDNGKLEELEHAIMLLKDSMAKDRGG